MAGSSIKPKAVLKALKLWHGGEESDWPLKQLRIATNLEQSEDKYSTLAGQGEATHNRAILNEGLKILAGTTPEASELLRLRFEHKQEVSHNFFLAILRFLTNNSYRHVPVCLQRKEQILKI